MMETAIEYVLRVCPDQVEDAKKVEEAIKLAKSSGWSIKPSYGRNGWEVSALPPHPWEHFGTAYGRILNATRTAVWSAVTGERYPPTYRRPDAPVLDAFRLLGLTTPSDFESNFLDLPGTHL